MKEKIQILKIAKPDRIWLNEIYERGIGGNSFEIKDIWGRLHEKLPENYRPDFIDRRLIDSTRERITAMGVMALQKNNLILKKINKVIYAIRDFFLKNAKTADISLIEIANQLNLSLAELSFYFRLASNYVELYNGGSHENQSSRLTSIRVDGNMNIFYNYREFHGIENLILLKSQKESRQEEYFNYDEMSFLNKRIDEIQEHLKILEIGQEVIWTDVMNELNELKDMYSLSKKNWRQMFLGKIGDMILSGIITETISKKIIEIFISQIRKVLNN